MIYKDVDGIFKILKLPRNCNPIYAQSLIKYLNLFDPLFEKARNKSEFDFVLTLLNIKGIQPLQMDPFKTTQNIFETIQDLRSKIKYLEGQVYICLLLYGLLIEASYLYELILNLINIIRGERYNSNNFPDVKTKKGFRPLSPGDKIEKIKQKAKAANLEENIQPYDEIYNREIRNAVFHSDYCYFQDKIVIPRSSKTYSINEIFSLIDTTLAYYEVLVNLRKTYIGSYTKPKVIEAPKGFSDDPEFKAVIMVREKKGVIGLKDNWTKKQIELGKIPFRACVMLPYEQKMIDKDPSLASFPPNRIERINKVLKLFPMIIRRHFIGMANRIVNNI